MSDILYTNFISAQHLKVRRPGHSFAFQDSKVSQEVSYCMIALATCFTAVRLGIRAWKRRFWLLEDIIVCVAWTCFTAMSIGYICVTDTIYRISDVGNKVKPMYPAFQEDTVFLLKIFFPNTLLLWTTLWLVKFALLLQCHRLIDRRPNYLATWWIIVAFTSLFYIGCVVTEFTSCRSLRAWFTFGEPDSL